MRLIDEIPTTSDRFKRISIPSGAINSCGSKELYFPIRWFQFLLVRLKAKHSVALLSKSIFQFLLVRLKVIMRLSQRQGLYISIPSGAINSRWKRLKIWLKISPITQNKLHFWSRKVVDRQKYKNSRPSTTYFINESTLKSGNFKFKKNNKEEKFLQNGDLYIAKIGHQTIFMRSLTCCYQIISKTDMIYP